MKFNFEDFPEDSIVLDGLDDAIIGITEEFGGNGRILYSREKILDILQNRDGMTEEESVEFYYFNIVGLYASESNPIFLVTDRF